MLKIAEDIVLVFPIVQFDFLYFIFGDHSDITNFRITV
jgi:hypothetical protein